MKSLSWPLQRDPAAVARPSIDEIMANPSYNTAVWRLKPTQEGFIPVALGRGGPIKISYEVHGKGPIKLVFVMGLAAVKSAWQRQTLKFGHLDQDQYSMLIYDNRGIGKSDKPLMRYTTHEMAKDLIEILDHLGWSEDRSIHVVGVSMGGMISQELVHLAPSRICSLTLVSTAARIDNTQGFMENIRNRINIVLPKTLDTAIRHSAESLFPDEYLDGKDDCDLPDKNTPEVEMPTSGSYGRFGINYERWAAQEVQKRLDKESFPKKGFLMQLIAAGFHYKSTEQLKEIGDKVGRPRIQILHGVEDNMITVQHGKVLIRDINPGIAHILEGVGHVIMMQKTDWFNETISLLVQKTEAMEGRA